MKRYCVIMAGGGGTRFWPVSRQTNPKQILNLTGNDVMINETIQRLDGVVPYEQVMIVTNAAQEEVLKKVVTTHMDHNNILLEPVGRNTAPCIGYAAAAIAKREGDALMCVLPSDHYMKDEPEFKKILDKALGVAEDSDKLVTIGIKPTFPCTGYGYIHFGKEDGQGTGVYEVAGFVEKPNHEKAQQYVNSGAYLWNSGMFIWKVSTILDSFKRFLPRLYSKLVELQEYIGTDEEAAAIKRLYPEMESISIDYGIMERSTDVLVIPGEFGWNDVGSWDALESVYEKDEKGNIRIGEHIDIHTTNSILYGKEHLIAAIGVDDMIIVHTEDATLICPKNRAQDVKFVVDKLKELGRMDLL